MLITHLIGGDKHPRAVELFDFDIMKKRIVSIANVKPYVVRTDNAQTQSQERNAFEGIAYEENANRLYVESDQDDDYEQNYEHSCRSKSGSETLLDQSMSEKDGPLSSTRRVTIADEVETRTFDPEETLEDHVAEARPSENSTDAAVTTREERISPYQMDFIIDDSVTDPTYKPDELITRSSANESNNTAKEKGDGLSNNPKVRRSSIPIAHKYQTRSQTRQLGRRNLN